MFTELSLIRRAGLVFALLFLGLMLFNGIMMAFAPATGLRLPP